MHQLNISLPDAVKRFVDGRVAQGPYRDASEYVGALIRADEERQTEAPLEAALLDGLDGPETALDADAWTEMSNEAADLLSKRRQQR